MALRRFEIDPDIRRAHTPPAEFYRDADAYDVAREKIFASAWHYVADAAPFDAPGWGEPIVLLPELLGEPLLVQSDANAEPRCLSNVCTHRANLVVTEPGTRDALRCGYHGRRFALDGRFVSMPCFEGVEGFPAASDSLPALPLEKLGPLLFTRISRDGVSFDDWIGPVCERLRANALDGEALTLDPAGTREFEVAAHWALYVENYLEGFHIPFVHPSLSGAIEWESYRTEVFPSGVLQSAEAKESEVAFASGDGARTAAYYFWLFPNLMLNFYPWGLSLNIVEPLSPRQTRVRYRTYVWNEELREQGAGSGLDAVELEDETIVEQVQRGIESRLYDRGRLSPAQEVGCHHFHRLLAAALFG